MKISSLILSLLTSLLLVPSVQAQEKPLQPCKQALSAVQEKSTDIGLDATSIYTELSNTPVKERRRSLALESPEVQHAVWQHHLRTVLYSKSLSANQCVVVRDAALALTPKFFAPGAQPKAVESQIEEILMVAKTVMPRALFREIFVTLGPSLDRDQKLEKACSALESPDLRKMLCSELENTSE